MIRPSRLFFPTVSLLVILAFACGGGNEELRQALETLQVNELDTLVLSQEELGEEFAHLEIDEDSGFKDNEDAAEDTIDPDDTADELERAGRINGYELSYSDPALSALEAGEGVIEASTEVELFNDGNTASDFLAKQVDDFQRLKGQEIQPAITLEKVETFTVDGLADEATGLRARLSFGDAEFYGTIVAFRIERLVGAAALSRADDADVNSQVEEIARALEERIRGVLLGDITGKAVSLPLLEPEERRFPRSNSGLDLGAMALSLDDLPTEVSVEREGYLADEDAVDSYEREFDLGLARIGASQFMSLESDVELYEHAREASGVFSGLEAVWMSESAAESFAASYARGGGFEVTNVRVESVPLPNQGDDSFGVHIFFNTPLGPFGTVLVFIRVDRVIGSLTLTGLAGEFNVSDSVTLAEAMAARMVEAAPPPTPEALSHYVDDDFGYSFDYPSDFVAVAQTPEDIETLGGPALDTTSVVFDLSNVISIFLFGELQVDVDNIELVLPEVRSLVGQIADARNGEISNEQRVELDQLVGYSFDIITPLDHVRAYFLFTSDREYNINCDFREDRFDEFLDACETVIDSFRIP